MRAIDKYYKQATLGADVEKIDEVLVGEGYVDCFFKLGMVRTHCKVHC